LRDGRAGAEVAVLVLEDGDERGWGGVPGGAGRSGSGLFVLG
jgi:hypothetical protein